MEEYKLYQKYTTDENSDLDFKKNKEYIFIGMSKTPNYWFLYKSNSEFVNLNMSLKTFTHFGLDFFKIIKDLNLEKNVVNDELYGYDVKTTLTNPNLKPILKDKLKNILNR
jgi:hypothetical protein